MVPIWYEKYLESAPKGNLSLHRKDGHVYYYQKYIGDDGRVGKIKIGIVI